MAWVFGLEWHGNKLGLSQPDCTIHTVYMLGKRIIYEGLVVT